MNIRSKCLRPMLRVASLLFLASPAALPFAPEFAPEESDSPSQAPTQSEQVLATAIPANDASGEPPINWRTFQLTLLKDPFQMKYSRRGLELQTQDGRFTSRIRWRVQARYSNPFDDDRRRLNQFGTSDADHLVLRRARFKVEGRMFGRLVNYKYEQDLVGGRMIDLYSDFNLKPWFKIRAGQWKSVFSQERYISSGSQQLAERSIVNREFTVDRQSGAMLFGRVNSGKRLDSSYFLEVTGGSGINSVYKDGSPMIVGRYQWNFFGREPEFSSSDIEGVHKPEAFIGISALHNRSRYTRFSSSGGGQLDGFTAGAPNQYSLKQVNVEFLLKYRGLSVQSENHWKNVFDNIRSTSTSLRGSYYQAGYFPHHKWAPFPKALEFAYRYAFVDGHTGLPNDLRQEHTVGFNYFLEGHTNKFTVDISRLLLARAGMPNITDFRHRVQYDVHF
jgi:phosphate-selective porin OprO/OprP